MIGSGREHEQPAEEVGRLLAERGATVVTGIGHALTLGRPVVVLAPGWDVEGALRAATPQEAVDLAPAAVA